MTTSAKHEKPNGSAHSPESLCPEIIAAAKKQDFEPAIFIRLVLTEMSRACQELESSVGHSSLEFKIKPLMAKINALRTLAETARRVHDSSGRSNVLDLEGRQFQYVMNETLAFVESGAKTAKCNTLQLDTLMHSIAQQWDDNLEKIARNLKDDQFLIEYLEECKRRAEARKKSGIHH